MIVTIASWIIVGYFALMVLYVISEARRNY